MDETLLRALLLELRAGETSVDDALEQLKTLPFADLGFARVDHHRAIRQGIAEVVLAEGKTALQISGVAGELLRARGPVLITRLSPEQASTVCADHPQLRYNPVARTATAYPVDSPRRDQARVAVVTAGTSDLPVAEEARETLLACGVRAPIFSDVGVAGLHRLLPEIETLRRQHVLIVAAGMEGALASVVGGLVACPVIAVPTSVGYGAAFGGIAAMLGMLTTCAAGVTVVNIDNGFGAAIAAMRLIDQMFPRVSDE